MSRPWGRNRLGVLAVALAAISVVSYAGVVVWSNYVSLHPQASAGKLGSLGSLMGFAVAPVAAAASAITGIAAVVRARRGRGGLAMAIAGLAIGGVLTALFAIWFLGLMLNPGALGG